MHRPFALTLLGSLACAPEISVESHRPRAIETAAAHDAELVGAIEVVDPVPELAFDRAGLDAAQRAKIEDWQDCQSRVVGRFEFVAGAEQSTDVTEAEIERLVAGWTDPVAGTGPPAKILITGWRSAEEPEWLDELRASVIRDALIEAGAPPSLLLSAGFDIGDPPQRFVMVQSICDVCCQL